MTMWFFIFMIVVVGCATPVAIIWMIQRGKRERAMIAQAGLDKMVADRLSALEARVQVLETIATDPGHQLRRDFQALEAAE
jgi:hypothetical protein